jgi:hypothetical protein
MRRTPVIAVVMVLLVVLTFGQSQAKDDFDYKQINPLRWMDPDRNPTSYREYHLNRQFGESFDAQLIYSGNKEDVPICIVINVLLQPLVETTFSTFLADLEAEGYSPNVYTAVNDDDEVALKNLLISEFNTRGIAGGILIGDLPIAWYEMTHPPDWGGDHVEFPIDLFFMDLDGTWIDDDLDGMYDEHLDGSGDMEADIWIGRLLALNLTLHSANESAMMNNYFDKNHSYRTGQLRLLDKSLAYIDNDWCTYGWENEVALAYPVTDAVTDPYETTREDYMQRVARSTDNQYENLLICSHSSPWAHYLYWGDGTYDYSLFYNHEIETIDVQVLFYNLFACSNCRFVEEDDMGNWYLFQSRYGLVSVGSTKTGSMLCFYDYYDPLGDGATFGEAFLEWCIIDMEYGAAEWSRPWFYGMTLLGDPTLRLSRFIPVTGDVNQDGTIDMTDALALVNYLFKGGTGPDPLSLGDVNADCIVDIEDAIYLLNYLFKNGAEPGVGCA